MEGFYLESDPSLLPSNIEQEYNIVIVYYYRWIYKEEFLKH